jgi:hypothetical protein
MPELDFRKRSFLREIGLYCHANCYDPDGLRQRLDPPSEWSERLHRDFDHVLKHRSLTANDYTRRTEIEFENDESLYAYVEALRDFLFSDGPYPKFEG